MDWRKSTYSPTGTCVEAASWRKSTHSSSGTSGECIEVGAGAAVVGVRDTKLCDASPVIEFRLHAWTAFTRGLKAE